MLLRTVEPYAALYDASRWEAGHLVSYCTRSSQTLDSKFQHYPPTSLYIPLTTRLPSPQSSRKPSAPPAA